MSYFSDVARDCVFDTGRLGITIMKYSECAPPILIKLYEQLTDTHNIYQTQHEEDESDSFAQLVNYLSCKSVPYIQIEGRPVVFWAKKELQDNTAIAMLSKLLSDTKEMEKVWKTISKNSIAINNGIENENDYLIFWRACHDGILEYRKGGKLTKSDHKKQYQEIHDLALQLAEKMEQSDFFKDRSNIQPRDLFWSGGIEAMLSYVNTAFHAQEDEKFREEEFIYLFVHYMFGYKELLVNIADKANELTNIKPLVLKPKDPNAYIQHFVITLSKFFRSKYGKPLHATVAATALVIFQDDSITETWVAKLVKGK
jgi:hypothetical protein